MQRQKELSGRYPVNDKRGSKLLPPSVTFAEGGGVYDFFALIEHKATDEPRRRLWNAFHISIGVDDQRRIQNLTLMPEISHKSAQDFSAVYDKRTGCWVADDPALAEKYNSMGGLRILAEHFSDCVAAGRMDVHVVARDPVGFWRRGGLGYEMKNSGLQFISTADTNIALIADPEVKARGRCQTRLYEGYDPDRLL